MNKLLAIVALGILLAMVSSGVAANMHRGHGCPSCGHKICSPEPVKEKTKHHCWCVEHKDICIPGIKGPFAACCAPPRCGRVRTIHVLKKQEYECEKCGYKWEVKTVCCQDCQPGK